VAEESRRITRLADLDRVKPGTHIKEAKCAFGGAQGVRLSDPVSNEKHKCARNRGSGTVYNPANDDRPSWRRRWKTLSQPSGTDPDRQSYNEVPPSSTCEHFAHSHGAIEHIGQKCGRRLIRCVNV
jgi:hypothetical protein